MAEIVTLNGLDIRFEVHGEGIPIVYTPGGFYPLEKGRLLAERLKTLGYKVLLWDRPNTGESGLFFQGDNLFQVWAGTLRSCFATPGSRQPLWREGLQGGLHRYALLVFILKK